MKTIFVILLAIVMLALPVLFIIFMTSRLPSGPGKKKLHIATAIGCLLAEGLFVGASYIPQTVNVALTKGITSLENSINQQMPGYTYQVLSGNGAHSVSTAINTVNQTVNKHKSISWAVGFFGFDKYLEIGKYVGSGLDWVLAEINRSGKPVTLHNIFETVKEKASTDLTGATRKIEWGILAVIGLFYFILLMVYFRVRKKAGPVTYAY